MPRAVRNRPALFWSCTGRIECAIHAPARDSDTWKLERWKRMTPDEIEAMHHEGIEGCEVCAHQKRQRAIKEQRSL
jgi:hypothetical protein